MDILMINGNTVVVDGVDEALRMVKSEYSEDVGKYIEDYVEEKEAEAEEVPEDNTDEVFLTEENYELVEIIREIKNKLDTIIPYVQTQKKSDTLSELMNIKQYIEGSVDL